MNVWKITSIKPKKIQWIDSQEDLRYLYWCKEGIARGASKPLHGRFLTYFIRGTTDAD